jgi:ABC-2 type transport system permease protein
MRVLWAFLRRDLQNEITYRLSFVLQLLGIFPVVLMFSFLARLFEGALPGPLKAYGGQYFPFVLIGVAVQNYLSTALGSFSGSMREAQLSGTLEAILATPVRLPVFLLGSTLYAFFFNSLRIVLYLLVGTVLCDAPLAWQRLPLVVPVMLLTITAFSSLGIFSASFILLFKRGDPLNWLFNVSAWLLGGVYYPIGVLPEWLQTIANLIPMTHALEALRLLLLTDPSPAAILGHVQVLGIWVLVVLPLSYCCFRYAFKRARITGTIGHY